MKRTELRRARPHPHGRFYEATYKVAGMRLHVRTLRLADGTRQAPDVIFQLDNGGGLGWMPREHAAHKLRAARRKTLP